MNFTEISQESTESHVIDDVNENILFPFSLSQIVPGLPKTRSGKIMRRILRKIAANKIDELGDTSTLADPSVVELIVKKHTNNNGVNYKV